MEYQFSRSLTLLLVMQGEEVDYRGVLHRDGSVLMSVSLDQLKVCCHIFFHISI